MDSFVSKLSSRKFWISVAAFLASIGGSVTGVVTDNEILTTAGVVCTVLSAAIYAAAEAYVDAADVSSKVTTVTATTTSKEAVAALTGTTITAKSE